MEFTSELGQNLTQDTKISLIVAVAENEVIGRDGGLPWKQPSDLKRFRKLTMGKPVIMGRKTYESIGKPLDGRENIVVTSVSKLAYQGVWTVPDIAEAIAVARNLCEECGAGEIMVIGGEQLYKAALPHATHVYLSRIHASPDGDAFFAALEAAEWEECSAQRVEAGPGDDHDWSALEFRRIRPAPTRKRFKKPDGSRFGRKKKVKRDHGS